MNLFDASAVLNLFRSGRADVLLEGCTIDLAGYELGNAVRRQVSVEKRLTLEEGLTLLRALSDLTSSMKVAGPSSAPTVLENSCRDGLSFYDASYLTAASEGGCRLVTDDERLLRAAQKRAKACRSEDIA